MTDPVKVTAPAPVIPPVVVVEKSGVVSSVAAAVEPEMVKVVTVKNPLPHAYHPAIRISNVIPTPVPNDGWTKCQLEAGILRLAE